MVVQVVWAPRPPPPSLVEVAILALPVWLVGRKLCARATTLQGRATSCPSAMLVAAIAAAIFAHWQNADVFAFHTDFSVEISLWRMQRELFAQHGIRAHAFVEGSNCTHDSTTCVSGVFASPSRRHAFVLDTVMRVIKRRRKPVLFIDGDMLPLPTPTN